MPFFKSTYNILKKPDEDEVHNDNWFDTNSLVLPPKVDWDYEREMKIDDVNIWEVICQQGGGLGLYASWDPYAEFYLITNLHFSLYPNKLETYYGANASMTAYKRAKELGMHVHLNTHWVEPENMWLYQPKEIIDLIL